MGFLGSADSGLGSVDTASESAGGAGGGGGTLLGVVAKFSGAIITSAGGATFTQLGDPGSQPLINSNSSNNTEYPTSARSISVLWVFASTGNGATPYTVTLYKRPAGGALAATTMQVTVPGGAAVGATFRDSAHPVTFADGDSYAVRVDSAATGEGNKFVLAQLEGPPPAAIPSSTLAATGTTTGTTPLSGIVSGTLARGTLASVQLGGGASNQAAYFQLTDNSARTVDNVTVVTAAGRAGAQWIRQALPPAVSPDLTSWAIDTGAGDDIVNTGAPGSPLKTVSELARRLAWRTISSAVTSTLTGNMAGTDLPAFTFKLAFGGSFNLAGVPTVIYTSTFTGVTHTTAAPGTTDETVTDAAVPGGSFTAAGALANGVIGFDSTSGGYFWFAKDQGATTARISTPSVATANGHTYQAQTLPQINPIRFTECDRQSGTAIVLALVYDPTASHFWDTLAPGRFDRVWLTTPNLGGSTLSNCCLTGSWLTRVDAPEARLTFSNGGLWRGTGTELAILQISQSTIQGTVTLQAMGMQVQGGFCNIAADIRGYDYTNAVATSALVSTAYWGIIYWSLGALTAANVGATSFLMSADKFSQIGYLASPICVAGSTANATPINIGGTGAISVAALTGGGGVVNAQQNGIFNST
ncbi:MAG TPA: hypothetical protein VNG35_08195 [Gemmatimonadales bacterium]|nr:hypothetical protein [Gemmatimonadales bacterium]